MSDYLFIATSTPLVEARHATFRLEPYDDRWPETGGWLRLPYRHVVYFDGWTVWDTETADTVISAVLDPLIDLVRSLRQTGPVELFRCWLHDGEEPVESVAEADLEAADAVHWTVTGRPRARRVANPATSEPTSGARCTVRHSTTSAAPPPG
ncbi:MAG: hypothetical protein OEY23_21815 [Acidimicrobiia bacterium]|nr:hypothetical protein [Acidimicrobiia bacterium]